MMIETINLKEMLPEWYQGVYEMNKLMEVEQSLLDELALKIKQSQDNLYVSTADSDTIRIYELMLKIATTSDDTLESRRFRVLTRLASQKPYTKRYLTEMIHSFGSPANITYKFNQYQLEIKANFEKVGQIFDLEYLIRTILPANILASIQNYLKANNVQNKPYVAMACTVNQFIDITQDFRQNTAIQSPYVLGLGQTTGIFETITQDFNEKTNISINQKFGAAQTQAEFIDVTQDFKSDETINVKNIQGMGTVTAEFITLGGDEPNGI